MKQYKHRQKGKKEPCTFRKFLSKYVARMYNVNLVMTDKIGETG